jgi:hypothetical protein
MKAEENKISIGDAVFLTTTDGGVHLGSEYKVRGFNFESNSWLKAKNLLTKENTTLQSGEFATKEEFLRWFTEDKIPDRFKYQIFIGYTWDDVQYPKNGVSTKEEIVRLFQTGQARLPQYVHRSKSADPF